MVAAGGVTTSATHSLAGRHCPVFGPDLHKGLPDTQPSGSKLSPAAAALAAAPVEIHAP